MMSSVAFKMASSCLSNIHRLPSSFVDLCWSQTGLELDQIADTGVRYFSILMDTQCMCASIKLLVYV